MLIVIELTKSLPICLLLNKDRTTWRYLLFYFIIIMLNMFRMSVHPSSEACGLCVELFHGLYCSVKIQVLALSYLFSGEWLVVTFVVVLETQPNTNTHSYQVCVSSYTRHQNIFSQHHQKTYYVHKKGTASVV